MRYPRQPGKVYWAIRHISNLFWWIFFLDLAALAIYAMSQS